MEIKNFELLEMSEFKLVIFGETHGFLEDSKFQKMILERFRPSIFLYEMLEDTKLNNSLEISEFLKNSSEKDFSVISKFGELFNTIKLANQFKLPIHGCDEKNMLRKNKLFLEARSPSEKEIKIEEQILFKREEKQRDVILKNLGENKKVFVSVGAYHLRPNSLLNKIENIGDYLIIVPVFNGEQIFGPQEDLKKELIQFEVRRVSTNGK